MDGDFITKEDELLKSIFGNKIFDQPDEETIKRRKLCQAEKYYKDNQDNSLFVEKVIMDRTKITPKKEYY